MRLVRLEVSDEELKGTFERARKEHSALPPGQRIFNSPDERRLISSMMAESIDEQARIKQNLVLFSVCRPRFFPSSVGAF